ncbi:MAG: hypothetical protein H7A08_04700 [Oceanospirillaceae bacterium]|nr:hypothetical protein [Oceanospirillaceae bacterium]MCP5350023.1 hypothetical protein [Oceanospirillaceae bacterium]
MKNITLFITTALALLLSGCLDSPASNNSTASCTSTPQAVNWNLLLTDNSQTLSAYRLFQNPCDPTKNPNNRGVPYDLAIPLFTDYASKYRFVFVPDDQKATYQATAAFDFPVGTVIAKTFALPADTAERGIENENLIETRLLIKRSTGWIALPYVWNKDKTDAVLDTNGEAISTSIIHDETSYSLNYGVPDPAKCKRCHQVDSKFSPIGPKARYLNSDYAYSTGTENQLQHWVAAGILEGLPSNSEEIDAVPHFNDSTDIDAIAPSELEKYAKGWLDINCGHCHRTGGDASNTNMHVNYELNFSSTKNEHGVCQKPISFGGGSLSWIITPGDADASIMVYRMNTRNSGDRMPPLGRDLIHSEGVKLVKAWINSMEPTVCQE